jgi:phage terminase Nu1 subunit (DNA packaging protein)
LTSHFDITVTLRQLSELWGVSVRWVNILVKEQGAPRAARGKYKVGEFCRWYREYAEKRVAEHRQENTGLDNEEQRIDIELKLDKLMERRGQLVPTDEVEILWGRTAGAVKSQLLSIPSKLSALLNDEQKERLEHEITNTLNELADAEISVAGIREPRDAHALDDGTLPSSAEGEPEPVVRSKRRHQSGKKHKRARKMEHRKG